MRFCLLLATFFFSPASPAWGTAMELSRIPLVRGDRYDPRAESGRGLSEFTTAFGLATFGNVVVANMDLKADILAKLTQPALARYYPDRRERNELASRIANRIRTHHLAAGVTNQNVNEATRYAAVSLVGHVIRRVMEKEGVKDPERRNLWANRIQRPFIHCMRHARTYQEGTKCLNSLQADLVKNLGLAMAYELVRQEMNPGATAAVPAEFNRCLQPRRAGADERVKACVTRAVRSAAISFGEQEMRKVASEQLPGSENRVATAAMPSFRACLGRASNQAAFNSCADGLAIQAGRTLASELILANEGVRQNVPTPGQRQTLARAGANGFAACMEENQRRRVRTPSGALATDNCSLRVRLDTAKAVAEALLLRNVESAVPAGPERTRISRAVSTGLGACWDSSSEAKSNECLRKSIETLVGAIADSRLKVEMPVSLQAAAPTLRPSLVSQARSCIARSLPADVLQSTDSSERVNACAAALMRDAAVAVGSHQLSESLRGKTPPAAAAAIIERFARREFASCLGERPTEAKLQACSLELRKKAAIEVARLLFRQELDKFFEPRGGLAPYGWSHRNRDEFLGALLSSHERCVNANVKAGPAEAQEKSTDTCFKASIETLSLRIAGMEFARLLKGQISQPARLSAEAARFRGDFQTCLREKAPVQHSLDDYISHIDRCQERLTLSYTRRLGAEQVRAAVEQALPGPEQSDRRGELTRELISPFETCLGALRPDEHERRNECTDRLKRNATRTLLFDGIRTQARALLSAESLPREITRTEEAFDRCLRTESLDACAIKHAKESARALARLKLHHSLGDLLGREAYGRSTTALANLEAEFDRCLEALSPTEVNDSFIAGLRACGQDLETKGLAFVQNELARRLNRATASAEESRLRTQASLAIPCLDPVLIPQPFREGALQALQPEGLLDVASQMVGSYIDYDLSRAEGDLQEILAQVAQDLGAAGPAEARRNLLDLLLRRGMMDQLVRAMARDQVRRKLAALPPEDRLPPEMVERLMSREVIEKVLSTEAMAQLRPALVENLLKPMLLEGRSLNDPAMKAELLAVERQVANTLLDSREFGDFLVNGVIQANVSRETGGFWRGMGARWIYGVRSTNWAEVRQTPAGRAADEYMREQVLRPMLIAEPAAAEMQRRREEAKRLVLEALKSR